MLAEDQIVDGQIAQAPGELAEERGGVFGLEAERQRDAPAVFRAQREQRLHLVLRIFGLQMVPGDISARKPIGRVFGKTQRRDAERKGLFDIFPLCPVRVTAAIGMGVIIIRQSVPPVRLPRGTKPESCRIIAQFPLTGKYRGFSLHPGGIHATL